MLVQAVQSALLPTVTNTAGVRAPSARCARARRYLRRACPDNARQGDGAGPGGACKRRSSCCRGRGSRSGLWVRLWGCDGGRGGWGRGAPCGWHGLGGVCPVLWCATLAP